MRVKNILIRFSHYGSLRLCRTIGARSLQSDPEQLDTIEYMLNNNVKEVETVMGITFGLVGVKVEDFVVIHYKWWEMDKPTCRKWHAFWYGFLRPFHRIGSEELHKHVSNKCN